MLAKLDVPYLAAHPVEFQTLDQWGAADARPAAGRSDDDGRDPRARRRDRPDACSAAAPTAPASPAPAAPRAAPSPSTDSRATCTACPERAETLAARVGKLVDAAPLPSAPSARSPIVLFNFPPNAGSTGTAAYLSVFESLHQHAGGDAGARATRSTCPPSVDALRERDPRRQRRRASAPTPTSHARIPADDHVRREPLPGARSRRNGARRPARQQSDGSAIFVLGARFGNVFVGVQPAFGYEGDPMRLLFEQRLRADPRLLAPSTAGCARISAPTRCCISAPTARSSSCPASRPACPATAGPTG